MRQATLVVLAKAPVPGRVKTRLCPPCTPEQAARLAAAALADTLDAVRGAAVDRRVLAVDRPVTAGVPGFAVLRQRGAGLAARIAAAFADAAFPEAAAGWTAAAGAGLTGATLTNAAVADTAAGGSGPVLLIGMDTPQVTPQLLDGCLAALRRSEVDAVLGPAHDGGWWLLGLHDPAAAALLTAVPMSTPDTYRLTLAALHDAALRVAAVPARRDVDTWPDAVTVATQAPSTRFAAQVRLIRHQLATRTAG